VAGWTPRSSLALVAGVALWVAGCASRPAPQPRPAGPAPVPAAAGAAPAAAADPAAAPAAPATEVTGVEAPVEVLEPLAELPTEEVVDELAKPGREPSEQRDAPTDHETARPSEARSRSASTSP